MQRRLPKYAILAAIGVLASTGIVLAHGGSGLRGAAPERFVVPTWLYIVTGGAVVGVSFLLASLFTDRDLIEDLHSPYGDLQLDSALARRLAAGFGVLVLAAVVVTGVLGPQDPLLNLGILVVWVGWWAGFTMVVYFAGNVWPTVDPFRAIARRVPTALSSAPANPSASVTRRQASWLGAFGLVALFAVEVVSPVAEDGALLALAVVAYLGVTLAATRLLGPDTWFDHTDPLSRAFRLYGAVAPVGRSQDTGGLVYRLPAAGLAEDLLDDQGDVAFVIALIWGTTFDGLVSTPAWEGVAITLVEAGIPPLLVYLGALVFGFGFFFGVYRVAARAMRRTAPTYLSTDTLARRFAPSLVAIAAGYHLAHNLTYFLALLPALGNAALHPLGPATVVTLSLPTWVTYLPVAFILLGHLGAVLVAHAVTFELVPGRLQAIRSQYPLTGVMILYTMTSLWIVSQPTVSPPFL